MPRDLIPSKMLPYAGFRFPSFWDEEDDDLTLSPISTSGLSVSEDDKNIYIEAAVPGIDPEDVELTYHDGYLWVRGETKKEEKDKARKYYRHKSSSFSYRVAVPGDIDENIEPEASYKNGVMTVSFTKSPKTQPKKIKLKTK